MPRKRDLLPFNPHGTCQKHALRASLSCGPAPDIRHEHSRCRGRESSFQKNWYRPVECVHGGRLTASPLQNFSDRLRFFAELLTESDFTISVCGKPPDSQSGKRWRPAEPQKLHSMRNAGRGDTLTDAQPRGRQPHSELQDGPVPAAESANPSVRSPRTSCNYGSAAKRGFMKARGHSKFRANVEHAAYRLDKFRQTYFRDRLPPARSRVYKVSMRRAG